MPLKGYQQSLLDDYAAYLTRVSEVGPDRGGRVYGAHLADSRESQEKKQIGELWARRSDGRCRFVWVENKDWQRLKDAVV